MNKIEFLKKDDISHKIFMRLWENQKVRYTPNHLPNFFSGYYEDCGNDLFIYQGNLYIVYGKHPILNAPGQEVISDEEIAATIRITENVSVEPKKGESKHLSAENLEKCYGLIEKYPETYGERYCNYKTRKPYE